MTGRGLSSRLGFVIVGTPRSGTTLVQRLANELSGIEVPIETHFFRLGEMFLDPDSYPMAPKQLRDSLIEYSKLPALRGADIDIEGIVTGLGGTANDPFDVFAGLVDGLTRPVAVMAGEKTPVHLRVWRVLAHAYPRLKFVWVVRDPRAVYASHLNLRAWGLKDPRALSKVWVADQRQLLMAQRVLGNERLLLMRYEDVVADGDLARETLGKFLGAERMSHDSRHPSRATVDHFLTWEQPWKRKSQGEVSTDRIFAWRHEIEIGAQDVIAAVCGHEMRRYKYPLARLPSLQYLPARMWCRVRAHHLVLTRELRSRSLDRMARGRSSFVGEPCA